MGGFITTSVVPLLLPIAAFILLLLTSWESTRGRFRNGGIVFTGILVLLLGVVEYIRTARGSLELLDRIAVEARRLRPQDFEFRLRSVARPPGRHASEPPSRKQPSDSLRFYALIGRGEDHRVEMVGTWARVPDPPPEFLGRGSASIEVEYRARDLMISGLETFPHIDSLSGAWIRIYVPRRLIEFGTLTWSHEIELSVQGRLLHETIAEDNVVEIMVPSAFVRPDP